MGSVSANADEKGATISNGVLNLAPADANNPGIVTKTAQTFGGVKTFSNGMVGNVTGNATTVTTNANLTGVVTSTGNTTSIANGVITNAMLANGAVANLSGTNTGDQTLPTLSSLGAVASNSAITGATNTKITYDAKGLVTAGAAATTADIVESTDKKYITDAQQTVINNTSGTNTGDQTLPTLSSLGAVASNAAITGATNTKITYDAKGLVTAGAAATTADIAESTDKKYVTDAQLTVINNTSGTNTGDQTLPTLSSLGAVASNAAITGATNTKITYDAKGLVTAGAAATTADIAESADKKYITDAQQTVINNTSGTNTGDQTLPTLSSLGAVASNSAITGATNTKITYDAKGLVTAGAAATTADIVESTDKKYVTDAQQIVINNTSGTNTGDQTLPTLSSLGAVGSNSAITGATNTKITYDAKGLVTAGAAATTADIVESTDKKYVTDAQLTVISNTSGSNSGDNAENSRYSVLVSNATHTGDVNGSTALTIANDAVTTAKISDGAITDSKVKDVAASKITGILPVANGGTGTDSLTVNNLLVGNGTSAVQTIAPTTENGNINILVANGTNWISKTLALASIGTGTPISILPPYLTINYSICLFGVYPSRNGSESYVGEICIYAFNFPPRNWALCDGSIQSISQNQALFSLLGTTYGGDGQSTFALPDLRGRSPIGQGQGTNLSTRVMGQSGGSETTTLLQANIPAHTHTVSYN
jgi:microcystin-dependent protein